MNIFQEKERIFTNLKKKDEDQNNTYADIDGCIASNNGHILLFG